MKIRRFRRWSIAVLLLTTLVLLWIAIRHTFLNRMAPSIQTDDGDDDDDDGNEIKQGSGTGKSKAMLSNDAQQGLLKDLGIQKPSSFKDRKFFLYMPWEQLNNQLIALRCACAAANVLNRTLVLPLLGYRTHNRSNAEWDFNFQISDLTWRSLHKYLDASYLSQLPCDTVSMQEFQAWAGVQPGFALRNVIFNPVAKATNTLQLRDYYSGMLGFRVEGIVEDVERMSQLTKSQILTAFAPYSNEMALAIGAAFWLYGFGRVQPYPLKEYFNYMDHPVYRQTVAGVKATPRVMGIVKDGLSKLRWYANIRQGSRRMLLPRRVLAIHVRRGDYWNKCKRIEDLTLRARCYPTGEDIIAALAKRTSFATQWLSRLSRAFHPVVYVATNAKEVKTELLLSSARYQFVFFEDVFPANVFDAATPLDPINGAMVDIELCSLTNVFIGNIFSSFSRSIFEKRELAGRNYNMF
ncbi:hypothetical protein HDU97_002785 [Phlyctochytrium planicorne]|nr:hypothetical protein HDU97_002785 [Phlyctochytrium planicorne]